jgi:peptide/nickel transport system substrate-binding protein
MKFTKRILAVGLVGAMLVTAGCSSKGEVNESKGENSAQTQSIVFAAGGDAINFNPLYANDRVSITVMNSMFNPLYVIDDNGEKVFYLADSIEASDDFLTYTVKLKKDLKWHDGKPLTADDIIFTMDSILDKNQNSLNTDSFIIDGKPVVIKKKDDTTIEFILPEVSSAIESAIGKIRPIAKHIYEGEKDLSKSEKNANPIGNGAYKFKEYKSGELITLEKFDEYYGKKANIDTVNYRIIADSNSANVALQNGEVNAKYVTPDEVENVKSKDNVDIITYDEGMVDNIIFFQQKNDNLKKKEVRQAIAYALNKEELIKASYKSDEFADKAHSLFAPNVMGYSDDVEKYEQNKNKAKELLKNAGIKDLKLTIAFGTHKSQLETTALVVQSNLKEIGIDVELKPMEKSAYFAKLNNPSSIDFDLGLNGYVMGNEPNDYAPLFISGNMSNYGGYENKNLDDKFTAALKETDKTKRDEIYKGIQQTLADDMVLYPIAYSKSIVALDKKYDGAKEATPAPIYMFRDVNELKLK